MAIKIIKEGKKVFRTTCQICGCEFSYEFEDVNLGIVKCPCCGTNMWHLQDKVTLPKSWPTGNEPMLDPFWYGNKKHPCEGCDTYRRMQMGETVIGDMCYWCGKNSCRVTCTSGNVIK